MKISIIMCSLNSMPYIMTSVESFKNQKYKNKELIIINTKSNDQTDEYLRSIKDNNIKVYNFNGNIYASMNFGIKKSSGKIIGILHSDDIFFNQNILSNTATSFRKENADIVYGNIVYSKKNNLTIYKRAWSNISLLKKYNLPPHTGVFIKKKILDKIRYNTNFSISSDTDLLLRIFKKKYKTFYTNNYICIMRMGGLSTNIFFIIKKMIEDIKIFYKNDLSFLDYFKKIVSKSNQFFFKKNIPVSNYIKKLNNYSKVRFFNINKFLKNNGKIISALNLAFISYDYKYKIRSHKYLFWPDGVFSSLITNKKKLPGREIFKKILKLINNSKKTKKIIILGNLPKLSYQWLKSQLKKDFNHYSLPYDNAEKIYDKIKKKKLDRETFIILTLPTPKQEILANLIAKDNPDINILCIGGSINMLSGHEKKAPSFLYRSNLEWLWRLKFDTKRRIFRLIESFRLIVKMYFFGENKIF